MPAGGCWAWPTRSAQRRHRTGRSGWSGPIRQNQGPTIHRDIDSRRRRQHRDGNDDTKLTRAAQAGDRQALEQLLRRHHDQIHAICRRLAGNDADGQDATQEALIAIVRGLPHFRGKAKFSTWAYRVATNAALDELRRRSRRPTPIPADAGERLVSATTPDEAAAAATRLDLDAALAQLPEEFRAPVVLRDVAGCDYAEIGLILGIPPGTVRSRIARARGRLAKSVRG